MCTAIMYMAIAGRCTRPHACAMKLTFPSLGFSALRMYAIYNRSKRVLAIVLIMGLINPLVNIVSRLSVPATGFSLVGSITTLPFHSKQCRHHFKDVERRAA